MRSRMNLRCAFASVSFAISATVLAAHEYVYSTDIRLMPRQNYNVDQEVNRFLAEINAEDHLSESELSENRDQLRSQFQRVRDGFTAKGKTVISAGSWGRYVSTIVPDLASMGGRQVQYLVRDNQTFSAPLRNNEYAHVSADDTGNSLGGPGDLFFLAHQPVDGRRTGVREINNGIRHTYELAKPIGGRTWIELDYTRDGKRILGAEVYMAVPDGGKILTSRYSVEGYGKDGEPSSVAVDRMAKGRLNQHEVYQLTEKRSANAPTYKEVLSPGQRVIDMRLGTDPSYQLSYTLKGDLPTLRELQEMRRAQSGDAAPSFAKVQTVNPLLFASGVVAVIAGFILFLRGRRHKSTST